MKLLLGQECVDASADNNLALRLAYEHAHTDVMNLLLDDYRVWESISNANLVWIEQVNAVALHRRDRAIWMSTLLRPSSSPPHLPLDLVFLILQFLFGVGFGIVPVNRSNLATTSREAMQILKTKTSQNSRRGQ